MLNLGEREPSNSDEQVLSNTIAAMCNQISPAILSGTRKIRPGDEMCLTVAEQSQFASSTIQNRRASGAARSIARELMARCLVREEWSLLKRSSGAPIWPAGLIGSMAHDEKFSTVILSCENNFKSIGIDIESNDPIDTNLSSIIATKNEVTQINGNNLYLKLLFCIKEAVYKATNVIDEDFLDFKDVEVLLDNNKAIVKSIYKVDYRFITFPRIVSIAYIR